MRHTAGITPAGSHPFPRSTQRFGGARLIGQGHQSSDIETGQAGTNQYCGNRSPGKNDAAKIAKPMV